MYALLLAALVLAATPVSQPPVERPSTPRAPVVTGVPTPDPRDPALRGLLLLAKELDESQGDACASFEVSREAAKVDAGDADLLLRMPEQLRLCEQVFDEIVVAANEYAKEGDFENAQAIGRYVLADGPASAKRSLRLQMVSWQAVSVSLRPSLYDEALEEAQNELRHARLYKARKELRTATLLWPNGAEARKQLAEIDAQAHERARALLAETRKLLAESKLADARKAMREALVLEAAQGAPHRAEALALALAVDVADAFDRYETPEKRAAWLAHCRKEGRRLAQQEQWVAARELLREGLRLAPGDPAITVELETVAFRCAAEAKAWLASARKRPASERAEAATDLRAAIHYADGPADPVAVEAKKLLDELAAKPR